MKTIFPCWDNGKKSYEKGGRMQCDVCGSFAGARIWKYRRGNDTNKWWDKITCVNCGSFEKKFCNTGKFIEQKVNLKDVPCGKA